MSPRRVRSVTDTGDELELTKASRKAWGALEAVHVLGYFADEVREAYVALGLRPLLSSRRSHVARRTAPRAVARDDADP